MNLEEQIEQIAETVCRRLMAEAAAVTPIDRPPAQSSEPLVGARAAAAHLSISERQLRQMVSDHSVPFYKVGSSVRFKLSELESNARVEERRLRAV
ncbi:MAG: excisionase family DNA-binding protein [Pyrinomonadaceae bacterium]